MSDKTTSKTAEVTIISIWSKIDGLEGALSGRDKNVVYAVTVPAGDSTTQTLENAYMLTNSDNRPMGQKACSTSVGDIMVLDGTHYLVDKHGYQQLTEAESAAVQKLSSRDTSGGWSWLTKHNLLAKAA